MTARSAVLPIALVALACSQQAAPTPVDEAAVRDSIRSALRQYTAAMRANDPAGVSRWWADDAVYMSTGTPTVSGRAAIDSLVRGIFAAGHLTEVNEHTDEILVDRDVAVQRGTYSETMQPQHGNPVHQRGRYVFVWRRQGDGSWKVARGIDTDQPGASPTH